MLTTDNNDAVENDLAANTKGVIFYSVPHAGSYIANYFQRPKVILNPSVEAMEMRSGNLFISLYQSCAIN